MLDDLQVYSGVLSANDALYLYQNPGSTVADVSEEDFNIPLNTTGLNWTTGGDVPWFTESTVTHDGVSAAQSGHITDDGSTYLQTTATTAGQLLILLESLFRRGISIISISTSMASKRDSISGKPGLVPEILYRFRGRRLALGIYQRHSGDAGLDAAFLDQVSFTVGVAVAITVNPFDQTNSPGYNVALLAAATGTPAPSFQWFKLGSGAITGATNALFIPTNAGTAAVAGSYYAIASNFVNSAITTTAAVTFVSAPFPADWAKAFKSPFQAQDSEQVFVDYYLGLAFDGSVSNNIYTAAEFGGNVTFGSVQLSSGTNDAAALVKQTTNGAPLWIAAITNTGNGFSSGRAIASGPGGGAYLGGNISGTNFINGTPIQTIGGLDMFLSRFDANGTNLWIKLIGGTNDDFNVINALASDSSGNITTAGLLWLWTILPLEGAITTSRDKKA